jgi:hypothetical protein
MREIGAQELRQAKASPAALRAGVTTVVLLARALDR